MAAHIEICNWARFQHYKDRDPPWIKLYRDMLSAESWVLGTDTSRLVQVAIILLAARYSNEIPYRWALIRKVASLDCSEQQFDEALRHLEDTEFLIIHGVVESRKHDASAVLASCNTTNETLYLETEQSRAETEQSRADPETPCTAASQPMRAPVAAKAKKPKAARESKTGPTWKSYSDAYYGRYGAEPIRNATVSGQLSRFVDRVGADAAPHVAAFYVRHNDRFYVSKKHPVGLLLSNAEGLHTEWVTGRAITSRAAAQIEDRQAARDSHDGALEMLKAKGLA